MTNSIYRNEKDVILEQMWAVLNRTVNVKDDAGCDWFTVDNNTYIGDMHWHVSSKTEVANLVNAINAFNGYTGLIYASIDEVPEHMRVKDEEDETQTYPLCHGCELVDVRLVIIVQIADEREQ